MSYGNTVLADIVKSEPHVIKCWYRAYDGLHVQCPGDPRSSFDLEHRYKHATRVYQVLETSR